MHFHIVDPLEYLCEKSRPWRAESSFYQKGPLLNDVILQMHNVRKQSTSPSDL